MLKKFLIGTFLVFALGFALSASASYDFGPTTLKVGSTGDYVKTLQTLVGATADGNFGPMTKAKVMAWQANNGLTADGMFGNLSKAKANLGLGGTGSCTGAFDPMTGLPCGGSTVPGCLAGYMFSPTTGASCTGGTTPTPLTGGQGDVTLAALSTYSGENVGEGAENVKVMGFSVEADDNSDIDVTSVKVEFYQSVTTDARKLSSYADEVTIWMGSTKVGSADPADFSESSKYYSKSISLDNAVVKAGETVKFYVAVSALENLDSGDIDDDNWGVDLLNVRYMDADGVSTTETGSAAGADGSGTYEKSFDFDSFASANAVGLVTALKSGTAADAINKAHIIDVESGTTDTDGVKILQFTLKAEGSDINVTEIPVTLTTGVETNESLIIKATRLLMGDEEIASEAVTDGGAVVFDNLDIDIEEGQTVTFTITVDLQDLTGALDEGDTVKAEITTTNADAIVAEDSSGEELSDTETSGSAVGEAAAVYDKGFSLALVSTSATKTYTSETTGVGDKGTFVITYKVTAFDGDIYLDNTCAEDNNGSEIATATSYSVSNDGNNSTTCIVTSSGTTSGTAFLIEDGTTDTITLTVQVTATADSSAYVSLEAIGWDDAADGDDNVFDFNLPSDFKTNPLFLDLF